MRGVFAGSGSGAMAEASVCAAAVHLAVTNDNTKTAADLCVLYLGTATYDDAGKCTTQTQRFAECGCQLVACNVANEHPPSSDELERMFARADIIVVSGGNTLFAMDRWRRLGVDVLIKRAAARGAVMSGGSAGAICWFDGGHSDSMDPTSYRKPGKSTAAWEYIRVDGLGLLPGLCVPHHDRMQSNGVPRSLDFNEMLRRHPQERGVCLDHWAVMIVDGDEYRLLDLPHKDGSVLADGSFSTKRDGRPGVWIKDMGAGDTMTCTLVPSSGKLSEILRVASGDIVDDPRFQVCRMENPSDY